jgi:hypothetical protein
LYGRETDLAVDEKRSPLCIAALGATMLARLPGVRSGVGESAMQRVDGRVFFLHPWWT